MSIRLGYVPDRPVLELRVPGAFGVGDAELIRGKSMSIAFLAPDIVERILIGNHSATLTPERLRKACPLPLRWDDQRSMLLR